MQLATSLNVLYDYTPDIEAAVARIAAAGFDALDFNGCDMMVPWRGPGGDEHLNKLKAAADRHGLPFVQAHGPMYDYFGEDAEAHLADTFRCMEWCSRLGLPWMVMHPYRLPGAHSNEHWQRCMEVNLDYFRQFIPAMERLGVGIAIENLSDFFSPGRSFGSVPGEIAKLCDALDHELFGLCWDTGHAFLQCLDQKEALSSLGSRLKVLHIQDNDGKSDAHLLPYHGKVKWDDVVAGLKGAGYQGAWTYETHNAVRTLPDPLRDDALRLAVTIGRHFTAQF